VKLKLLLIVVLAGCPPPQLGSQAEFEARLERDCLKELNRIRKELGISQLELSERLLEVARSHSRRMAERGFFSHVDPEGRGPKERVKAAGLFWQTLGENLAAVPREHANPVAFVMHGWMSNPGHRKTMLRPDFKYAAVGVWSGPDRMIYFTAMFLR
jgi:uncharacterized protein YkwD